MPEFYKEYDLGNGCSFICTNPTTAEAITVAETDLLQKAEANENSKMEKFYDRVKRDQQFRNKKCVSYVLFNNLDKEHKKEGK